MDELISQVRSIHPHTRPSFGANYVFGKAEDECRIEIHRISFLSVDFMVGPS